MIVVDVVLLAADSGSGNTALLVVVVVVVLGWLVSLVLHPWTACSACKGSPRHYGAVATKSFRLCSACGGSGRQLRFGARMFRGE
jgi:DnaJ-class molecular chaperone